MLTDGCLMHGRRVETARHDREEATMPMGGAHAPGERLGALQEQAKIEEA